MTGIIEEFSTAVDLKQYLSNPQDTVLAEFVDDETDTYYSGLIQRADINDEIIASLFKSVAHKEYNPEKVRFRWTMVNTHPGMSVMFLPEFNKWKWEVAVYIDKDDVLGIRAQSIVTESKIVNSCTEATMQAMSTFKKYLDLAMQNANQENEQNIEKNIDEYKEN